MEENKIPGNISSCGDISRSRREIDAGAADNRMVLLAAAVASFITPFMASSVNIALPSIAADFGIGMGGLGWIATSYLLASAAFLLPFGRLADIYGRKKIFVAGNFLYAVASLLSAVSPAALFLIVFRVFQGIAAAMIFATSVAIVTSAVSPKERGIAIGVTTAAVYLGLSAGPILGGFLTRNLGWRSIFWINVPLGIFALVLIGTKMKSDWKEARGEAFDAIGTLVYVASLAALIMGFTNLPNGLGSALALSGVSGLGIFFLWERRSKSPLLETELLLGNRVFAFSSLAALINYSASFAVGFLLSLYLQNVKALNAQQAGMVMIAQPVVMAAFSPLAGRISDFIEPRLVASAGMAVTGFALLLLSFLNEFSLLRNVGVSLALLGFGLALFSSPNTNAVMASVDRNRYGTASSALATMRMTGQSLSLGLAMLIFSLFSAGSRDSKIEKESFIAGMHISFLLFASLCVPGVLASLARGKSHRRLE